MIRFLLAFSLRIVGFIVFLIGVTMAYEALAFSAPLAGFLLVCAAAVLVAAFIVEVT